MRAIDKYNSQNDEFIHPLWLGILLLFSVIIIISILCCLRIKCGSQLYHLFNRLFGRNIETNDNTSNDDIYSTINYPYNWPSIYSNTKNQSPKLYTLVNNIRRAHLQKQLTIKQQNTNEDENEIQEHSINNLDQLPQISTSLPSDNIRNSEIARKFYASMRNTSQCQSSPSNESYHNDTSTTSSNVDQPIKPIRQGHMRLFRTPKFFKSIPNQESLTIAL